MKKNRQRKANKTAKEGLVVLLDPELSKIFPDAASVNRALQLLADIAAAIARAKKRTRARR